MIRTRVSEIFSLRCGIVTACVQAAIDAGELPEDLDSVDTGTFIIGSMQGATMLAKAQKSIEPMRKFRRSLMSTVLRQRQNPTA